MGVWELWERDVMETPAHKEPPPADRPGFMGDVWVQTETGEAPVPVRHEPMGDAADDMYEAETRELQFPHYQCPRCGAANEVGNGSCEDCGHPEPVRSDR